MTPCLLRKLLQRVLPAALLLFIAACGSQNQSDSETATAGTQETVPTVRDLSVQEVRALITENPDTPVIDVRTAPEYTGPLGHIDGARLLTLQEIDSWAPTLKKYADRDIVLVCRSGNRSGHAARYLADLGYTRLINVAGGMIDWNRHNYPIVADTSQREENQ